MLLHALSDLNDFGIIHTGQPRRPGPMDYALSELRNEQFKTHRPIKTIVIEEVYPEKNNSERKRVNVQSSTLALSDTVHASRLVHPASEARTRRAPAVSVQQVHRGPPVRVQLTTGRAAYPSIIFSFRIEGWSLSSPIDLTLSGAANGYRRQCGDNVQALTVVQRRGRSEFEPGPFTSKVTTRPTPLSVRVLRRNAHLVLISCRRWLDSPLVTRRAGFFAKFSFQKVAIDELGKKFNRAGL
ncbi:hypothetical protein EVAR_11360_1 [Eumeta japonica]|uniref:Uncharacterized protein n=1 Tax=Eumeta variegata TaxID=151549 RepID=A0A4C1U156_EUMVA|nr:hypothetical protein EVAR_11360_1 [Eumeta japonica]